MNGTDRSMWPKQCRCGFTARNEEQAQAHRVLEHPESFEDGEVVTL